jgi:two-component system sensor histidine kinase HydH
MTGLSHLSLRWRLMLAFLLVSAPPVLVASYVASQAISAAFHHNIEHWLEETVRFFADEAKKGEDEADKSAGIIAAALATHHVLDWTSDDSVRPFVDLLTAAGYDLVTIYDQRGATQFSSGSVELAGAAPSGAVKSVFQVRLGDTRGLAIGAARPFETGNRRYVLVIANLIDDKFFAISKAIRSLDLRVLQIEQSSLHQVQTELGKDPVQVPKEALRALLAGAPSAIAAASPDDDLATAFAGLRDHDNRLVGIIACRFTGPAAALERLAVWQLFVTLALISGLISVLVSFFVARRISRPVQVLTKGLRAVATGDYQARVPQEGGRELEELAAGFNTMTEQLEYLRSMEAEMRRRQQFASLGEAAAVIAHEIRNPLGIIKTSSQVVRTKAGLRAPEDRLIGFILEEVARIDRLVQEILDYVRPKETHRKLLDPLRDVIDRVSAVTAPELHRHGITCVVLGRADNAPVWADADQLYQALLNLILNAVDAMPDGGRLTIHLIRDGDTLEVHVEDDGTGIDGDVKARIFDPFYTTKAKGTGLGLAKTKAIIEDHGGTISCGCAPGRGARFTIRLPVATLDQAHEAVHLDR